MSKMKQATLFSLKTWKKTVTEDVVKYKKVLESQTLPETVTLKTLACLKQKNITKESILSAEIGEVLKTLAKGSNLKVAHEARALIKYWNLDIDLNHPVAQVSVCESQVGSCETQSEIEIVEVRTPMDCTSAIDCSKTTTETKLNSKLCFNDKTYNDTCQVKDKLLEEKLSDGFSERQVMNLKSEKKSLVRIPNKELQRRLGKALELFTQAIGEQEVQCYLHNSSLFY